ncbi:MAG: RadC family protein [Roseinatronobacter sp.]
MQEAALSFSPVQLAFPGLSLAAAKDDAPNAPSAPGDADLATLGALFSRVMPRVAADQAAASLINRFHDLPAILMADRAALAACDGVPQTALHELELLGHLLRRIARRRLAGRPVLSSWQAVLEYCHAMMAGQPREELRVLFLNTRNVLIADEVLAVGTVDHVPVYPREVMRRALELNASALVLVHNHPSGDPTPSEADITMTGLLQAAAQALSITLHDHIIIGRGCETSLRSEGYL